jgi:hypothetical protein
MWGHTAGVLWRQSVDRRCSCMSCGVMLLSDASTAMSVQACMCGCCMHLACQQCTSLRDLSATAMLVVAVWRDHGPGDWEINSSSPVRRYRFSSPEARRSFLGNGGSFLAVKLRWGGGGGCTHLPRVSRFRVGRAVPPTPHIPSWLAQGQIFIFVSALWNFNYISVGFQCHGFELHNAFHLLASEFALCGAAGVLSVSQYVHPNRAFPFVYNTVACIFHFTAHSIGH